MGEQYGDPRRKLPGLVEHVTLLSTYDSNFQPEFEFKCSQLGRAMGCLQQAYVPGLTFKIFENSYLALPRFLIAE